MTQNDAPNGTQASTANATPSSGPHGTRYDVVHETRYAYSEAAFTSHNVAHLMPRATDWQRLEGLELRIDPSPPTVQWQPDYFGNDVVFFTILEPHDKLVVRVESSVELLPRPELSLTQSPAWEDVATRLRSDRDETTLHAYEMAFESPFVPRGEPFADYARASFTAGRPLAKALLDLNARIHREFRYDPEATTLATPIAQVLEERHGVCQDFAHLMIGCLRSLGLPARYVSGYLRSADPKPDADPQPDADAEPGAEGLVGSEASHAWVSAWCPENGWIDVDPTNDVVPSDRHIVLGWGRDYDDVSPLKGVTLGGGAHTVSVEVSARPIEASP